MNKWARTALIVGCVGGLATLLLLARRAQNVLERGLPPRELLPTQAAALTRAAVYSRDNCGMVYAVVGTGSMAPYLPAAPLGRDPKTTVVAYAVTRAGAKFDAIKPGSLVVYAAVWNPEMVVMHGAAQKDGLGWIMSGLHNERSEADWRVTLANFRGIVAQTMTWEPRL